MQPVALQDDIYSTHLAKINEKNKVVSTEDIFSSQGVLLVAKATPIDDKTSAQLVKHKLKKSLTLCVAVENLLDEKQLYQSFQDFLGTGPEIRYLHHTLNLDKSLKVGCVYYRSFPVICQKLTVMAENLPDTFHKAVAGAWFALALGYELGYRDNQLKELFLAGLVRDLGMMHIDPDIIENSNVDYQAKRGLVLGHVLIGKLVLDEVEKLPAAVKNMVFEHHERCDGAGYPKAKLSTEISEAGLALAMADTIQEIYVRFCHQGKNLAHLEGFMMLNTTTFSEPVYRALASLVKHTDSKPNRWLEDSEVPGFIENLISNNASFMNACIRLNQLGELISSPLINKSQKEIVILGNFIERITEMRVKAGVPSMEYCRWLEYVLKNRLKDSYTEMEMVGNIFDELAWQLDQVKLLITTLWHAKTTQKDLVTLLEDCAGFIDKALQAMALFQNCNRSVKTPLHS